MPSKRKFEEGAHNASPEKKKSRVYWPTLEQNLNYKYYVEKYWSKGLCVCCEDGTTRGTMRDCQYCVHNRVLKKCSCLCDSCYQTKVQEADDENSCALCVRWNSKLCTDLAPQVRLEPQFRHGNIESALFNCLALGALN